MDLTTPLSLLTVALMKVFFLSLTEGTSHQTDILLQLCCQVLYCGRLFKHPCGFIKIATADRINVPKGH